jgi:hypothetical protein
MMQKCLIAASLLVFIVSPVLAAEYYVAHKKKRARSSTKSLMANTW